MKVLHIDSGIMGEASVSRQMSAKVMSKLMAAHPDATVVYRDFANDPVAHLTPAHLAVAQGFMTDPSPELAADLAFGGELLDEFMASDVIVIGASLYNLTVSTGLKAWLDRILIAGRTFRYSEDGVREGLAKGKKVILCVSRGGFYQEGGAAAAMEYCERYLRDIFAFIGIEDVQAVTADGTRVGFLDQALAQADEQIAALTV